MNLTRTSVILAAFVSLVAALGLASGASAKTVRTMPLNDGMNRAQFKVPHQSKSLPPAIVYYTKPADLECAVAGYRYGSRETRGRMKISVRCQDTPKNARAKLVFRAPYIRQFPLRDGTSKIRIRADKPRGKVQPLGSLSTIPRETKCDVTPTGRTIKPKQFTATARIACEDLPEGAKGIFGLGGLVSAGDLAHTGSTATVTSSNGGAITSGVGDWLGVFTAGDYRPEKCEAEKTLELPKQKTFRWKTCYSAPFVLQPWESQWVGFGNPTAQCPSGWSRSFAWTEAPTAWLFSKFDVRMWTDSGTDWYGWSWGLVTNWQINESIQFRFEWNCYNIG